MPDSESRVLFDRVQSQSPERQQQARENIGLSAMPLFKVEIDPTTMSGDGTQENPLGALGQQSRMPTAYGGNSHGQEWTFPYALNSSGTTIFTIPVSAASLAHVHIEFGLYNNDFTGLAPWVGLNDLRTNVIAPDGSIIGANHDMDCFVDTAQPTFSNTRFSIDFAFRASETGDYQVQWRTPEVSYAANSFRMNNMHWNWWY